jgi:hypothetical protein
MSEHNHEAISDEGRLYEIQREVAAKRKGAYHLVDDIYVQPLTRGQAKAMRKAQGEEAQLRILLGDSYDRIDALFDDKPIDEWVAFQQDMKEHFYGKGVDAVAGGSQGS